MPLYMHIPCHLSTFNEINTLRDSGRGQCYLLETWVLLAKRLNPACLQGFVPMLPCFAKKAHFESFG